MTKGKPFRFSLRTLFVGLSVAAVVIAIAVAQFRAYERWQHSIKKVSGTSGFLGFNASCDWIAIRSFRDRQDRP